MPSADVGRQTRAQILRAAMDIASVKGLSGLSIGELAGRLGMSKSGLFRHFGAKEQLQLATVEAAVSVFEAEVVAPAMAAPPGVDRVRASCMRGSDTWNATCSPAAAFSRPRPPTWTHSLARCATASPRPGGPESPPSRPTSKRRNAGARSGRISKRANSRSSCTPTRWRPTGRCCCSTTTAPESGRERRSTRPWPESAPPRRESNHEICQPY
ncbi:TetR family transcriptional regulator [Mycobacterium tuberculosis]|nr:TetR family transcriptional regulator [Mycobacterium tuberculosis]